MPEGRCGEIAHLAEYEIEIEFSHRWMIRLARSTRINLMRRMIRISLNDLVMGPGWRRPGAATMRTSNGRMEMTSRKNLGGAWVRVRGRRRKT